MGKLLPPSGADRRIYHITHVTNLPGIITQDLVCDAERIKQSLASTNIGYAHIKKRRLTRRVPTRGGGNLGDYVPFNFCPRSVMLYVVNKGHGDYSGGQEQVVHLVSTIATATRLGRPWAFTDRHAEVGHALYFNDLAELDQVPWTAVDAQSWSSVKEEKQAELLVKTSFPWTAIEEIGVMSNAVAATVHQMLTASSHRPPVVVRPGWYY